MKNHRAFTLIEVIVVVIVLGILATILTFSYRDAQRDARNAKRAAGAATIAEALEKYYDTNGEYPGCPALTADGQTVVNSTLKGLHKDLLTTPTKSGTTTNSITCTDLTAGSTNDIFALVGDGTSTCQTGAYCTKWTLKYIQEGSSEIASISSRRQ